jgi:hypothetical protein
MLVCALLFLWFIILPYRKHANEIMDKNSAVTKTVTNVDILRLLMLYRFKNTNLHHSLYFSKSQSPSHMFFTC